MVLIQIYWKVWRERSQRGWGQMQTRFCVMPGAQEIIYQWYPTSQPPCSPESSNESHRAVLQSLLKSLPLLPAHASTAAREELSSVSILVCKTKSNLNYSLKSGTPRIKKCPKDPVLATQRENGCSYRNEF